MPSDIDGLTLWLDADDPDTITANASDEVSQWDDKSGANNHVSRTASTAIKTGTATLNSRNVISHLSSGFLAGDWPVVSAACTVFVVWDLSAQDAMVAVVTGASNTFLGAATDGNTSTALVSNMGTPTLYVDGTPVAAGTTRDGLHTLLVPNATVFTASNAVTSNLFYRTSYTFAAGFETIGGLAEVVVYSGALSTADRETVESYLADKWGITL